MITVWNGCESDKTLYCCSNQGRSRIFRKRAGRDMVRAVQDVQARGPGARKIPVGIRGEAPAGDLRMESSRCWSNFVNAQRDI